MKTLLITLALLCALPAAARADAVSDYDAGWGPSEPYGITKFKRGKTTAAVGGLITATGTGLFATGLGLYAATGEAALLPLTIIGAVGVFGIGPGVTIAGGLTARSGAKKMGVRVSAAWGVMSLLFWHPVFSLPFAFAQVGVAEKALREAGWLGADAVDRWDDAEDRDDRRWTEDDEDWDDEDWYALRGTPWSLQLAPAVVEQRPGMALVLTF